MIGSAHRLKEFINRRWRTDRAGSGAEPAIAQSAPDDRGVRTFSLRLPEIRDPNREQTAQFVAPREAFVARLLSERGLSAYEATTTSMFLTVLELADAGAVIDVGANVGLFSVLAGMYSSREIVAFEPTPALAQVVSETAALNSLDIRVEQVAVGDQPGTATLYLSALTDASNSIKQGFRPASGTVEVTVDTLDDFCARTQLVPALIKIDVESAEPEVIAGARCVLQQHRPWVICEILNDRIGHQIWPFLRDQDYIAYHLSDDNPAAPASAVFGDTTFAFNNWLFAPRPLEPENWNRRGQWLRALSRCTPRVTASGTLATPPLVEVNQGQVRVHPSWTSRRTPGVELLAERSGQLRIVAQLDEGQHYYLSDGSRGFDRPSEEQHLWAVDGRQLYRVDLPVANAASTLEIRLYAIQFAAQARRAHHSSACRPPGGALTLETEPGVTSLRVALRIRGSGEATIGPLTIVRLDG